MPELALAPPARTRCPLSREPHRGGVLGTLYRRFVLLLVRPVKTDPVGKRAHENSETRNLVTNAGPVGLLHSAPPFETLAPDRERAERAGPRFADGEGQRLAREVPEEVRVERAEVHRGCRALLANERQAHVLSTRVLGGHHDHLAHERLELGEGLLVVEIGDRHVEDSSSQAVPGSAASASPPVPALPSLEMASRPVLLPQSASVGIAGGRLAEARPHRAEFYARSVDSADNVRSVRSLECVEGGRVSRENERGWTARLTVDDDVAVYYPECDRREFGELRR